MQANPLLLLPSYLTKSEVGKGASLPSSQGPSASWTGQLSDVLLYLVRESSLGCSLLLRAMLRVNTDLRRVSAGGR